MGPTPAPPALAQLAQRGAPSPHCQALHPWDSISPRLCNWHYVSRRALGERPSCVPLWLLPVALWGALGDGHCPFSLLHLEDRRRRISARPWQSREAWRGRTGEERTGTAHLRLPALGRGRTGRLVHPSWVQGALARKKAVPPSNKLMIELACVGM